jgi:hypothetical protein
METVDAAISGNAQPDGLIFVGCRPQQTGKRRQRVGLLLLDLAAGKQRDRLLGQEGEDAENSEMTSSPPTVIVTSAARSANNTDLRVVRPTGSRRL